MKELISKMTKDGEKISANGPSCLEQIESLILVPDVVLIDVAADGFSQTLPDILISWMNYFVLYP